MSQLRKIIKIFKEFTAEHLKLFWLLFFILIIEGLVASGVVLTMIPFADYMLDPELSEPSRVTLFVIAMFSFFEIQPGFWSFSLFFVGFNLLNGAMKTVIRYFVLNIKYRILRNLFKDTINTFFQARWGFFSEDSHGKILNTLNKELNIIGDTIGHIAMQFAQIVQLFIYLLIPFWLNASMTITALALAILFGLPFLRFNRLSYALGKSNTATSNIMMGVLSETLQSARIILGFGKQKSAKSRYIKAFDEHMKVTINSQTLTTAIPLFFAPLGILAAVIALGLSMQNNPLSELVAVLWSLLSALPILAALLQTNISINNFIPSYEQLTLLRSRAIEYVENKGSKEFKKLSQKIELHDVCFSYPGRNTVINNLSLCVKKGSMTALVGESGSGKSTIMDLILGLQIPSSGQVLIDNIPLSEYQQNSFRERIGYVPQEPILFHVSIRENLLWANEIANEDELWTALKMSNAENFVKQLPQGIDTVVGDRGGRLSGGQRQRIALARALVRKPELIILDEATSSLDTESELMIQKSIENLSGKVTILVIAHRLSTIKKSSKVYVLKGGSIIEHGPFDRLRLRKNSALNKMLIMQNYTS